MTEQQNSKEQKLNDWLQFKLEKNGYTNIILDPDEAKAYEQKTGKKLKTISAAAMRRIILDSIM